MLKMDIPKTFKPEQNLEANTQRLLEEEIKLSKPEPKIEKMELEEVLKQFDQYSESETLHSKIDKLIEKSGYNLVKSEKLKREYWCKTNPFDEDYIFIRLNFKKEGTYYAFAKVGNNKLKEFYKRFSKYESDNRFDRAIKYFFSCVFFGVFTGLTVPLFNKPPATTSYILIGGCIGAVLGFAAGGLAGMPLSDYLNKRNEKKLENCCEELIIESREAIKAAFS